MTFAGLSESGCGCCGRLVDETEQWCADCESHGFGEPTPRPWESTWSARHNGLPCPYEDLDVLREWNDFKGYLHVVSVIDLCREQRHEIEHLKEIVNGTGLFEGGK